MQVAASRWFTLTSSSQRMNRKKKFFLCLFHSHVWKYFRLYLSLRDEKKNKSQDRGVNYMYKYNYLLALETFPADVVINYTIFNSTYSSSHLRWFCFFHSLTLNASYTGRLFVIWLTFYSIKKWLCQLLAPSLDSICIRDDLIVFLAKTHHFARIEPRATKKVEFWEKWLVQHFAAAGATVTPHATSIWHFFFIISLNNLHIQREMSK